ncbi:hypothetical protein PAEPH01_0038 [Pancytospora epiphaga]|nr:hypothetical protein PAEPH01_0038 [Pancytospora epiphaga]
METKKFIPDEEAIKRRAEVRPFGRAAMYDVVEPEMVSFVLSSGSKPLLAEDSRVIETPVVSSYVPPVLQKSSYNTGITDVTVRVSNIPKTLSNREVYDFLMANCGRCFERCNLAYDKETRESRGIAYVTLSSNEKASEFAHKVMTLVIDNLKLGAEILKNR